MVLPLPRQKVPVRAGAAGGCLSGRPLRRGGGAGLPDGRQHLPPAWRVTPALLSVEVSQAVGASGMGELIPSSRMKPERRSPQEDKSHTSLWLCQAAPAWPGVPGSSLGSPPGPVQDKENGCRPPSGPQAIARLRRALTVSLGLSSPGTPALTGDTCPQARAVVSLPVPCSVFLGQGPRPREVYRGRHWKGQE